jgi:hypothetical protein
MAGDHLPNDRYPLQLRPATLAAMSESGRLYRMIAVLLVVVVCLAVVTALQSQPAGQATPAVLISESPPN